MHLNLIWSQSPESLAEAQWIRWLFQDFEITEHVALEMDLFKDKSIYILSSNRHALSGLPRSFLEGIRDVNGKGLFHLSDESFSGGYDVYTDFDFVFRNYHSAGFTNPGIRTLPLGFTYDVTSLPRTQLAADRRFLWSFAGAKTAARMEMVNNLKTVE